MLHYVRFILLILVLLGDGVSTPIQTLTSELADDFTERGRIPLEYFYVDDTDRGGKTHYKFSNNTMAQYIAAARKTLKKYESKDYSKLQMISNQKRVYAAIAKYKASFEGKRVAVLGSQEPWVEAIALACLAQEVVTIDYNYLTYSDDRIRTVSGDDFDSFYTSSTDSFDIVISISSIDHSGLGRYSDELNPRGDLEAMDHIWSILKPDTALLFLTIPIGPDLCIFNLMRRYGNIRLDMLFGNEKKWEIVEKMDWKEEMLNDTERSWRNTYEPVIILKKKGLEKEQAQIEVEEVEVEEVKTQTQTNKSELR